MPAPLANPSPPPRTALDIPVGLVEGLGEPPDWDELFGMGGPLELEIGAGKGGFALGFGHRHPERRLVAMEVRHHYATMTREKVVAAQLGNVLVLRADAKSTVPKLFAEASLDAIHVYFPDPWWKRRHFKRRVVDRDFSRLLLSRLRPGASLHVRTDVEERAHDMLAVLTRAGFSNPRGPGEFAPFDAEEVPTTREQRYLASGHPVWRLRLHRAR
jgi:tRNA (guanine-N7-)-methyltransferase